MSRRVCGLVVVVGVRRLEVGRLGRLDLGPQLDDLRVQVAVLPQHLRELGLLPGELSAMACSSACLARRTSPGTGRGICRSSNVRLTLGWLAWSRT